MLIEKDIGREAFWHSAFKNQHSNFSGHAV
jgi:hypothetical protein